MPDTSYLKLGPTAKTAPARPAPWPTPPAGVAKEFCNSGAVRVFDSPPTAGQPGKCTSSTWRKFRWSSPPQRLDRRPRRTAWSASWPNRGQSTWPTI